MEHLFLVCLLLWVPAQDTPAKGQFRARLSTVPIDIAMQSTVAGRGSVTATLIGQTLTISGDFEGLKSPATSARIHSGPDKGIRGPALHDLAVSKATRGAISGSVELTMPQVDALRQGRLYIQLQSEKAPEGNLWGWLLPQAVRR